MKRHHGFCDGIQRRDFLRVGGAGLFGASCTLLGLLEGQAAAAERGVSNAQEDRSLIIVFLRGGLSPIDTWDLKPNAPVEFRGEFDPISTNVPGIEISELMPRTSQQMDKFSLIRSVHEQELLSRSRRPLHAHQLSPGGRLQRETDSQQSASVVRVDHREEARPARFGAAVRLRARHASQLRRVVSRRVKRPVQRERRPS